MTDLNLLAEVLDDLHQKNQITCVISGKAKGADTLGEVWAKANGIPVAEFPADWDKYGKAAGHLRNSEMIVEGKPDYVVAFLHPRSRGTKNMIKQAKGASIPCRVIGINGVMSYDTI
jgi:hypothetical protein